MPKVVIAELDVKLSKKDVIKLCDDNNISWLEHTNVNGGKYIECIVGYNCKLDQSEFLDIYYNCISNRKLYGLTYTKPKQFYIDLIMEYFLRKDKLVKTINIIFKQPRQDLILSLEGVVKTEIIFTKPFNTPILVVTYRGLKQEFFSFINIDEAQKLKDAIDEKRDFILLESI